LAGFSPRSFDRICRIVSIMARIASGRVKDASCLSIQASTPLAERAAGGLL
jgi:hypothetical protein